VKNATEIWIAHCYESARRAIKLARLYPYSRELFLYNARRWRDLAREARRASKA
jgi:hypothetical protein